MGNAARVLSLLLLALGLGALLPACEAEEEKGTTVHPVDTLKPDLTGCSAPMPCGNLSYVDCGSASDGPSYYLERATGKHISTCGGACWHPTGNQVEVCKTLCPPKEWTCGYE